MNGGLCADVMVEVPRDISGMVKVVCESVLRARLDAGLCSERDTACPVQLAFVGEYVTVVHRCRDATS